MGLFSWKIAKRGKSIPVAGSSRPTFTVYMVAPDGRRWKEEAYGGYGIFGGKDFFDLLDELNGGSGDRGDGIEKYYDEAPAKPVVLPRFSLDPDTKWESLKDPVNCPHQGYFYPR